MESKLARALYDNTAECADELAFKRGELLLVLEQKVAGGAGWWLCSLHGRRGLAPANRLQLLQPGQTSAAGPASPTEAKPHNIYQIPRPRDPGSSNGADGPQPSPSGPDSSTSGPAPSSSGPAPSSRSPLAQMAFVSSDVSGEVYDVPSRVRRASLSSMPSLARVMTRKASLVSMSGQERMFQREAPGTVSVYAVPPSQDPNYDVPVPWSSSWACRTLPSPRRRERIYDVPLSLKSESPPVVFCDSSPCATPSRPLPLLPPTSCSPPDSVYDVPKFEVSSPARPLSRCPPSGPSELLPEDGAPCSTLSDAPSALSNSEITQDDVKAQEEEAEPRQGQRISSASSSSSCSSSSSSCDPLALGSPSPEPQRQVCLSQEDACRRLLVLQEDVCRTVARLMDFVSIHWRSREHLDKHLQEIRQAAEGVAAALSSFLGFSLDVKGNATRLTDTNLQTRLHKQLGIVEDSGLLLQQSLTALGGEGWAVEVLSQDPNQVQKPDQLERFVMVARTVPEDVRRLVSIINANGKLLFRAPQQEAKVHVAAAPPETKESEGGEDADRGRGDQDQRGGPGDTVEDDNDYVELQTRSEFEQQKKDEQSSAASKPQVQRKRSSALSEHCRLYFGALQKAISGFVGSLQQGQPPENFISHSKLVIMVGQRLVDTLCRESQSRTSGQDLLSPSSHLCALLKQLAVATKKAALHFPDKQTLLEAQEFAQQLAQRAQHFRMTLEL